MHQSTIAVLCDEITTGQIRWEHHHAQQMFERSQPSRDDIRYLLCEDQAEIIEATRDDPRGQKCLIWGTVRGQVAHVLCFYPPGGRIVTAYWPHLTPDKWTNNYRTRVRRTT